VLFLTSLSLYSAIRQRHLLRHLLRNLLRSCQTSLRMIRYGHLHLHLLQIHRLLFFSLDGLGALHRNVR